MKTLKQIYIETIYDRATMPQVATDDLKQALTALHAAGVNSKMVTLTVDEVRPSQTTVDQKKIDGMIQNDIFAILDEKPIIISNDGFIVDGHHRWYAVKQVAPESEIPAIQLDLPRDQAIRAWKELEQKMDKEHA